MTKDNPTCLVIDDDSSCRDIASMNCKGLGFIVDEADSAEEAIKLCQQKHYSLIVIDWKLPRMSGLDFLQYLNDTELLSETTVIFSTMYSSEEKKKLAFSAGAKGFLTKPYRNKDFIKMINEVYSIRT